MAKIHICVISRICKLLVFACYDSPMISEQTLNKQSARQVNYYEKLFRYWLSTLPYRSPACLPASLPSSSSSRPFVNFSGPGASNLLRDKQPTSQRVQLCRWFFLLNCTSSSSAVIHSLFHSKEIVDHFVKIPTFLSFDQSVSDLIHLHRAHPRLSSLLLLLTATQQGIIVFKIYSNLCSRE